MPSLPARVQTKLDNYITQLLLRYPPESVSYKISAGYGSPKDAKLDYTPVLTVYTINDQVPVDNDFIYTDSGKTTVYDGNDLWYHFFNSAGGSMGFIAQISSAGRMTNKTLF